MFPSSALSGFHIPSVQPAAPGVQGRAPENQACPLGRLGSPQLCTAWPCPAPCVFSAHSAPAGLFLPLTLFAPRPLAPIHPQVASDLVRLLIPSPYLAHLKWPCFLAKGLSPPTDSEFHDGRGPMALAPCCMLSIYHSVQRVGGAQ